MRIGLVASQPMFPALYQPKQKWRFRELIDPQTLLGGATADEVVSRTNCASVMARFKDKKQSLDWS